MQALVSTSGTPFVSLSNVSGQYVVAAAVGANTVQAVVPGSALVAMIILPLSVLLSFIAIRYLGLTSNIMSLGGIAIAVGELADAAIVLIENAHSRLAAAPPGADRAPVAARKRCRPRRRTRTAARPDTRT